VKPARLTELRLTEFKSFRDEVLPLGRLTVLIGGNAAGKSNALEGLHSLSRLAQGMTLREALTGSPQSPSPIRGGADGCAPADSGSFKLGCTVRADEGAFGLDVLVRTGRELSLQAEELTWSDGTVRNDLVSRIGPAEGQDNLSALRLSLFPPDPSWTREAQHHHEASRAITSVLQSVTPLDPDPRTMRGSVPRDTALLLPDGSNLSAVIERIRDHDSSAFARLEELIGILSEGRITRLDLIETPITNEVQLLLREASGPIPARLASDGTLRCLAFAAALLDSAKPHSSGKADPEHLIMIEEVERGLYPSQAGTLLDLMRRESAARSTSVLLTTHSPALLAALKPEEHRDVIVCSRDPETGLSRLRRLIDLPGYPELIAAGGLGEAISTNGLAKAQDKRPKNSREFFDFLESL
jgi:hypothetical protein